MVKRVHGDRGIGSTGQEGRRFVNFHQVGVRRVRRDSAVMAGAEVGVATGCAKIVVRARDQMQRDDAADEDSPS